MDTMVGPNVTVFHYVPRVAERDCAQFWRVHSQHFPVLPAIALAFSVLLALMLCLWAWRILSKEVCSSLNQAVTSTPS